MIKCNECPLIEECKVPRYLTTTSKYVNDDYVTVEIETPSVQDECPLLRVAEAIQKLFGGN